MTKYLFTCSSSKNTPDQRNASNLENLSFPELLESRTEILNVYENQKGNLDWNMTLPAWKLYRGSYAKFFRRITEENWQKNGFELFIFSTLFGWVKHTDLVPNYRLDDNAAPLANFEVMNFWGQRAQLLLEIDGGLNDSIDLLPNTYLNIFNNQNQPIGIRPDVIWTDKYGTHKGNWFNEQLNQLH